MTDPSTGARQSDAGPKLDPTADWWSTPQVARWIERPLNAVYDLLKTDGFPSPEVLPTGPRRLRWKPEAIIEWHEAERIAGLRWPVLALLEASSCSTQAELSRALDISPDAITRNRLIPDHLADRWASQLGLHPIQVWGWAWVDAALPPADVEHQVGHAA